MRTASEPFIGTPLGGAFTSRDFLGRNRARAMRSLRVAGLVGLQLLGLWSINIAGALGVRALGLPIPGALAGMILLYALLALGAIKIAWFDMTGSFLVRHLAFFFVPIAVGVMDAGGLLANDGIAIALTLVASAAAGIALSGFIAQALAGDQRQRGDR